MIQPASFYLGQQEIKHDVALLVAKAASMWLPWRFAELNLSRAVVEERLRRFGRLFPQALVDRCLYEMEEYKLAGAGVSVSTDLLDFWRSHAVRLPGWHETFLIVALIQPSSAAAERGFSQFESIFGRNNLPQATEEFMETQLKAKMNKSS